MMLPLTLLLACGDDTTATGDTGDTGTTGVTDTGDTADTADSATTDSDTEPPPPDSGTPVHLDGGYEGTITLTLSRAEDGVTDTCEGPVTFNLAHFKDIQLQGGFECPFPGDLASVVADPGGGLTGAIGAGGALSGGVTVHVIEQAPFTGAIDDSLLAEATLDETVYELLDSESGEILETWTITGSFTAQGEPLPPPG